VKHLGAGSSVQWDPQKMELLPHCLEMIDEWEKNGDTIVLMTARPEVLRGELVRWLRQNKVYFHALVMDVTSGDRFLYNDRNPPYVTRAIVIERNGELPKGEEDHED